MIDFPPNGPTVSTPDGFEPVRPTHPVSTPLGQKMSNPLLIVVAWLVVAVPLAWGVTQTVKTSMALFHPPQNVSSAN